MVPIVFKFRNRHILIKNALHSLQLSLEGFVPLFLPLYSQGCYLDECKWLALVQVDSGTYTGDTESLE